MKNRSQRIISVASIFYMMLFIVSAQLSIGQPFLESKIVASDGTNGDYFGWAVALSGDRALIGAYRDGDDPYSVGSAYVFELKDGNWAEVAKLIPGDGEEEDIFGHSVALAGDYALIGAPYADDNGDFSGAAYVFELQNGSWVEVAKLIPSDNVAEDWFGYQLSISGNRAIIGAHRDDDKGQNAGAAYVFERQDGNWVEVAKITADDGAAYANFGRPISMSGDRVLIGAYFDNGTVFESGSAYIFELQGGKWKQVAKLNASDGATGDKFARSVFLSDDRAVVGAPNDDDKGFSSGSAYVFQPQDDGTWNEIAKLTASDGEEDDYFGWSISTSGDRVVVGALQDDDVAGAAYIYELLDGNWSEIAKLTSTDRFTFDRFTSSLVIQGDRILIGAQLDDDNGSGSGSAYVYEFCLPEDSAGKKIECLAAEVINLFKAGLLDPNQRSQLSTLLKRALSSVQKSADDRAINEMKHFTSRVLTLLRQGHLSPEDAQYLLDTAADVQDLLEADPSLAAAHAASGATLDKMVQDIPEAFALHPNHPNPFNPTTTIRFSLPEQAQVRITVYDMLGREMGRLVDGVRVAGSHEVTFDAGGLPSGTYLYRLETPQGSFTNTMLLLK